MSQTEVVTKPQRLTELLTCPEIIVNGIIPVNDETLYVNWCYTNEALLSSTTSVVIAAFTTAQARLELFKYLHTLGPRALYYDADSVFYVSREDSDVHDLLIGVALSELTDELASNGNGTYITSFLSRGPKFYAYKFKKPDGTEEHVCKVKGIRLNYSNSLQINFDTVCEMIPSPSSEILLSNFAIRRTAFHDVITQNETKTCKTVYGKRRFVALSKSYLYGYVRDPFTNDSLESHALES